MGFEPLGVQGEFSRNQIIFSGCLKRTHPVAFFCLTRFNLPRTDFRLDFLVGCIRFPDLLEPAGAEKQFHAYQKSLPEASRLVQLFSMEGMTVLDPFAGAGTVVEACVQNKRSIMVFEKDPKTFRILQERFPRAKGED